MAESADVTASVEAVDTQVAETAVAVPPELAWSVAELPEPRRPLPRGLRVLLALVGVGAVGVAGFVGGRESTPPAVAVPPQTLTVTASPPLPSPTPDVMSSPVVGSIDQNSAILIDVLKKHRIPVPGNWYVITHAKDVCDYYDQHPDLSLLQAEGYVQSVTVYDRHDASVFVYAATQTYCPNHLPPG